MTVGVHYTGVVFGLGALLLAVEVLLYYVRRVERRGLGYAGYTLIIVGYILYLYSFIVQDYSLKPVYETSAPGLTLLHRIGASWATGGGSLVVYTVIVALIALTHRITARNSSYNLALILGYNILTISGFILSLLLGGFDRLEFKADYGLGLNPVLKSIWLLPHPLAVFTAYALITASAVSVLAGRVRASDILAKVGWIFITLGNLMGGYWAYETLGWGGYWAWDPVETATLVPWLFLTAYFHVKPLSESVAKATIMMSASSVYLAMAVTRTGLSPLHSFAEPRTIAVILLLIGMILFLYRADVYLRGSLEELYIKTISKPKQYSLGLLLSYTALLVASIAVYVSLLIPVLMTSIGMDGGRYVLQGDNAVRALYPILYPSLILLLSGITLCTLALRLSFREHIALVAGVTLTAVILAYLTYNGRIVWAPRSSIWTNTMISFALPYVALALASTAYMIVSHIPLRDVRQILLSTLHMSMALLVLGILLSGPYSYNPAYFTGEMRLKLGDEISVGDVRLKLVGYKYELVGEPVDVYTPYAGKSMIFKASGFTLLLLAAGFTDYIINATRGETLLKSMNILEELGGRSISGYHELRNVTVTFTVGDRTFKEEGVRVAVNLAQGYLNLLHLGSSTASINLTLTGSMTLNLKTQVGNLSTKGLTVEVVSSEPLKLTWPGGRIKFNITSLKIVHFNNLTLLDYNRTLTLTDFVALARGRVSINGEPHDIPLLFEDHAIASYAFFNQGGLFSDVWRIMVNTGVREYLANRTWVKSMVSSIAPEFHTAHVSLSGLLDLIVAPPIPRVLPEGVILTLEFEVADGGRSYPVELKMRFDVNGEIQGIKGLVPKPLIVGRGLTDVYLEVYPPYVRRYTWGVGVHELLAYYIHEVSKNMSMLEKLGLASLFASATVYSPGDPQALARMMLVNPHVLAYSTLELLDYMVNFNPQEDSLIKSEGLVVRAKIVPKVKLVWLSSILMVVAELLLILTPIIGTLRGRRLTSI